MTDNRVVFELAVLAGCFVTGLVAGMLYDLFRFIRLPFRKSYLRDAIFDLVYYAAAGALCALALFELNGGAPRLYALAGFALGAFAYIKTVSEAVSAIAGSIAKRLGDKRKQKEAKGK